MNIAGFYSDGTSAQRSDVELSLFDTGVRIRSADRSIDLDWDGAGLRLLEEVYQSQPVRVMHQRHPEAVLTITDELFFDHLLAAYPHLSKRIFLSGTTGTRLITWSAAVVGFVAILLFGLPPLAGRLISYAPDSWSEQLGESVVTALTDEAANCGNGEGLDVLNALAHRLAGAQGYLKPITVHIVGDSTVNAFAAPGGHVVFFSGLIDQAESGDEVAGVLAHELAHVMEDHAMQGLAQTMAMRFVIAALLGDVSGVSSLIANLGGSALISNYSRGMEADADRIAVRVLNDSGFHGGGLTDFFVRLQEEGMADLPDVLMWLSSHPLTKSRIALIEQADQGGTQALSDPQWQAVKAYCADAGQHEERMQETS